MTWEIETHQLGNRTIRYRFMATTGPVSWASMIAAWGSADAAADFTASLLDAGYRAFRWECPPLDRLALDDPFECVVVDDPSLDVAADAIPFREHLATPSTTSTFPSLGGASTLIAPAKTNAGRTDTAHLGAFLRTAPDGHIADLWQAVADAVQRQLDSPSGEPFWLSTAGGGVAWLHVRIDPTPKYYHHDPYRHLVRGPSIDQLRGGDVHVAESYQEGIHSWAIEWGAGPFQESGDRLTFHVDAAGTARFVVLDVAGKGRSAEQSWSSMEQQANEAVRAFCQQPAPDLHVLGEALNRASHDADVSLCLAAGSLDAHATLTWAAWGWGTHVLAAGPVGFFGASVGSDHYGIKLGWLEPAAFADAEQATVLHRLDGVDRFVAVTDGVLGNDHADVHATLAKLAAMGTAIAEVPGPQMVHEVMAQADLAGDDVTVFALEVSEQSQSRGGMKP